MRQHTDQCCIHSNPYHSCSWATHCKRCIPSYTSGISPCFRQKIWLAYSLRLLSTLICIHVFHPAFQDTTATIQDCMFGDLSHSMWLLNNRGCFPHSRKVSVPISRTAQRAYLNNSMLPAAQAVCTSARWAHCGLWIPLLKKKCCNTFKFYPDFYIPPFHIIRCFWIVALSGPPRIPTTRQHSLLGMCPYRKRCGHTIDTSKRIVSRQITLRSVDGHEFSR